MVSAILVVNAGSSSYKCKLYATDPLDKKPLWEGTLDKSLNAGMITMCTKNAEGKKTQESFASTLQSPLKKLIQAINVPYLLAAIGHRVVHGGTTFTQPVRIDQKVKTTIKALIPLAPIHNPENLKAIEEMEELFPHLPQFAVFDTSFHLTIPPYASTYPIPQAWSDFGIRRYGFHGISHQYSSQQAALLLKLKHKEMTSICCHLGNGCSITAIEQGKSIDTSMGFTPLEGLMMGTRSGSIDPGIVFFLERDKQLSAKEIEQQLNHESGLKAISQTDGDMRLIMQGVLKSDANCLLAVEMFTYKLAFYISGFLGVLGRADALIFTGGIGENTPLVREKVCLKLRHLGFNIDEQKNKTCKADAILSPLDAKSATLVIHTEEEWAIAQATLDLLQN